ncbi:phosphatidylinositol N-acetylglucosaminyltransferase subunit C [Gorgonomyces haynaldii]|nr:phosphatidylinositol N-acetylglucosaminyltransferase subunit C [Gorgonomyces haynaldii]
MSKWQKLLYIEQPYPDNYVDESFLIEMKKNQNVRELKYLDIVYESTRITQQLTSVFVFVWVFFILETIELDLQVFVPFGSLVLFYLLWRQDIQKTLVNIVFIMILSGLTPILKNLTREISDDTIWAFTLTMLLLNLLFHDYSSTNDTHTRFPDSLSINAAMSAAVLLGSRLDSNQKVFVLMLTSILLFALFPILRRVQRNRSQSFDVYLSVLMTLGCLHLWIMLSPLVGSVYLFIILFTNLVGPWILVSLQKYKSEIQGPWDEARIE